MDSLGTAAGIATSVRGIHNNDGANGVANLSDHGWSLDPPRLTETFDRGIGDPDSPRTAVDPRHRARANAIFADGHAVWQLPEELGYRLTVEGCYADADPNEPCSDVGGSDISAWLPDSEASDRARDLQVPLVPGSNLATNRYFSGSGRNDDPPPLPD